MSRIVFDSERPTAQADPARTDVACFVGLVRCNPGAVVSPAVLDWLNRQGWVEGPFARPIVPATTGNFSVSSAAVTGIPSTTNMAVGMPLSGPNVAPGATIASIDSSSQIHMSTNAVGTLPATAAPWIVPIGDVPIPIETYPAFTALFDPGGSSTSYGTDYVAAAVRTFFAQGGNRCYVVRMDDPLTPNDTPGVKNTKLQKLLPSSNFAIDDQRGWHGAAHLAGLPDVSFLVMPDLPALTASAPQMTTGPAPAVADGPEQFVECAQEDPTPAPAPLFQYELSAPRLTPNEYARWAQAVQTVTGFLSAGSLREMLFVAAFPLPQDTDVAAASESPSNSLTQDIHDIITAQMPEQVELGAGISTAFLQLAYPWLKTTGSGVLLEGLEPPDGALTGLLARNALTRGTFTSATKVAPSEVYDVSPILPDRETAVSATPLTWGDDSFKPLIERLSLFGFTSGGLALLSDVTAYPGESYRPGRIHRLVAVILRASRTLGEQVVFQQNGPLLWARVRTFLRQLMTRLWQLGALDGPTIEDAFTVSCDRSTMTQNDLDSGRLVAVVSFNAASTIELIRVTLALETSGTSAQSIAALAEVN